MSASGSGIFDERMMVPVDQLGDKYQEFRFVDPGTEAKVRNSLARDGQITPLVVCRENGGYQVLDGLKRLRACREMPHVTHLEVQVLRSNGANSKALMLRLNESRKSMCMIEQALLLQAMHHQDGLAQTVIAQLLHRHPSWVCRRIALVERLHEKVIEHMRLGLIAGALGREIVKLPHGNQPELMAVIEGKGLNCCETGLLVRKLQEDGEITASAMEIKAQEIVAMRGSRTQIKKENGPASLKTLLRRLEDNCTAILDYCEGSHAKELCQSAALRVSADSACEAAQRTIVVLRG